MKTASSSPTVNLLDLNAGQSIKIVGGAVTASGLTSPSIFVDGASGSTVNAGWHHIAVTTGTAVNASAVNLGLNATTTAPLDGVLDDVRFYNRVINTDEIKRLYRIGATLKINTSINNDSLIRGLVGYWSFDGKDMAGVTAYDRSGNANNGTLTNGPTRAIGKIGQGLSFDGVNDYVGDTSSNNSTTYTYAQWIKPSNASTAAPTMQSMRNGASNRLWFYYQDVDRSIAIQYQNTVPITQTQNFGTTVTLGVWQHIVLTVDLTSGVADLYMNGAFASTRTLTNAGSVPAFTLHRIGSNSLSDDFFLGLIDDVRIYNRALSASEIQRLYNLGR